VFGGTGERYGDLAARGCVAVEDAEGGALVSVDADGGGDGYVALVTLQGLTAAGLGNDFLVA
jgi:hypothetical protein